MQHAHRGPWIVIESSRVSVAHGALVVTPAEGSVLAVPLGTVSVCGLGPGCSITHEAVKWLAHAGTVMCWTGADGAPVYAHGAGPRDTTRMARQARALGREDRHLAVARRLWALRTGRQTSAASLDALRGEEGAWMQQQYLSMAARFHLHWDGRTTGSTWDALDSPNRALSVATHLLYGVLLQVCLAAGVTPGLGILHVHTRHALVYDLADLWKGTWLLPIAWQALARGTSGEAPETRDRRVRTAVRGAVHRDSVFAHTLDAVQRLFDVPLHRGDRADPALTGWTLPSAPIP
jgi:CRISPR-associated protein Cas1